MLPDSNGVSPAPPYLGTCASVYSHFRVRDYYPLWWSFPEPSANKNTVTPIDRVHRPCNPATPIEDTSIARMIVKHVIKFRTFRFSPDKYLVSDVSHPQLVWQFRLFRFRSPLLTESLLISLPPGTKMFQFPGYATQTYVFSFS